MIQTLQRWLIGGGPSAIAGRDAVVAGRDAFVNCTFGADPAAVEELTRLVKRIEAGNAPLQHQLRDLSRRFEVTEQALAVMVASTKKAGPPSVAAFADRVNRHKDVLTDLDSVRDAPGFGPTYLEARMKINAGDHRGAEAVLARDTKGRTGFEYQYEVRFMLLRADLAFMDWRYAQAGHLYVAAGELLEGHDVLEAAVCFTQGSDALFMGGDPSAEPAADKALALLSEAWDTEGIHAAHAFKKGADSLQRLGRVADAEAVARRAVHEFWKHQNAADPVDVASSLTDLGIILYNTDRIAEAIKLWDQALTFLDRAKETARTLGMEASLLKRLDRYDQALPVAKRQLAVAQKDMGADNAWLWASNYLIASIHEQLSQPSEAIPYAQRAVELSEIALGANHPLMVQTLPLLAGLLLEVERAQEAEPLIRRALKIAKATKFLAVDVGLLQALLGSALFQMKKIGPAEKSFEQGIKSLRPQGDRRLLSEAMSRFAFDLVRADRHAKVEALFRESISILEEIYPPDHYDLLRVRIAFGNYLISRGRGEEGANSIIDAHRANPGHPEVKRAFESLLRFSGYVK